MTNLYCQKNEKKYFFHEGHKLERGGGNFYFKKNLRKRKEKKKNHPNFNWSAYFYSYFLFYFLQFCKFGIIRESRAGRLQLRRGTYWGRHRGVPVIRFPINLGTLGEQSTWELRKEPDTSG